ncbi:DUF3307 domain-containing protein [Paractinoplanes brasiliensis]|uniref:Uncharacterized protein DUF3307 n=1 Tax=Paractinoplanes brasiliensis TaxID=52695 RepID=A0A4R6JUR5_9ACTN|nr:DUF3307 domain-containing protein [Actinoplanes brasiliensis]TDO38395.1 uncharacterized protein DUF3307 [Actinoplanes brasiliensis]GID26828.1 hypothetical protein Abr02nite_18110 [Actinoplanes brasiliensis]
MTAGVFAAVFAALFVAHQVADHWVQTQHQADGKGLPGWPGRIACAGHVASYTATAMLALAALHLGIGVPLNPWQVLAGMTVSAVTHYVADRRTPLKRLAELAGSAHFYALGSCRTGRDDNPSLGTGAYALDQSFHYAWLFVAALIIA